MSIGPEVGAPTPTVAARSRVAATRSPARAIVRAIALGIIFFAVLIVVWEGAKLLGGDPWRFRDASGAEVVYTPPFKWKIASDLSLPHVWEYDPTAGTWSLTGSTTGVRGDEQTAVVLANGRVPSIGGDHSAVAGAEVFDPVAGQWSAGPELAAKHTDLEAAVTLADGRLLLVSASAIGGDAIAELYDPTTGQWSLVGSLGGTRYIQSATLLPDGSVLVVGSSTSFLATKPFVGGIPSAERLDPAGAR